MAEFQSQRLTSVELAKLDQKITDLEMFVRARVVALENQETVLSRIDAQIAALQKERAQCVEFCDAAPAYLIKTMPLINALKKTRKLAVQSPQLRKAIAIVEELQKLTGGMSVEDIRRAK